MNGNHFCHICGGLVDLIKLQPSGVRFCECEKRFTQLRAENERLRAELAEAKKERDEIKAQAMMLDRMVDERDEQLAAALAACEAKDAALEEAMGWNWLDDDVPQGIITLTEGAYHIKPDASILKAHDNALIERVAKEFDYLQHTTMTRRDIAAAIRELKETL